LWVWRPRGYGGQFGTVRGMQIDFFIKLDAEESKVPKVGRWQLKISLMLPWAGCRRFAEP